MKRFKEEYFVGCLMGGAIGDALGYPVEFKDIDTIKDYYGPQGIRDFKDIRRVHISDDTQMTLFTANGLICTGADQKRGLWPNIMENIYASYIDWLRTQESVAVSIPPVKSVSWLLQVPEMKAARAPGKTCLSALSQGIMGTMEEPVNGSKGCGGVMRAAPAGLYTAYPLEAARLAAEAAAITHGHPLGYIPAAVFAYIINRIIYTDRKLTDIISGSIKMMKSQFPQHEDDILRVIDLLIKAVSLIDVDENADDEERLEIDAANISVLGEGWVAEEALAIAVYCALKYEDNFERAVAAAVNHSGDSDSTGSLVGNILGAIKGVNGLPVKFVDHLEMNDVIEEIGQDLFTASPMYDGEIPYKVPWSRKYHK